MAEVPVETLSIDDLARTTEVLLSSGAPIQAMNAVRRHLSALKGGRLALAGPHLGFATVAISDVVGDPPEDVASGPTVGDPTTFRDALGVLERFHLRSRLPPRVSRYLARGAQGDHPETPKPTDPSLRRAVFRFGATNRTALRASAREARRRGYRPRVLPKPVVGETQPAALRFARKLLRAPGRRSLALLGGGETTVTLGPHPGRGGRNQEFALATAGLLAGRAGVLVLSAGTDGIDGPTDAAGGWADGTTLERLEAVGVDLGRSLHAHAAYPALDRIGGLLRTGPTGTNVTDLHVGLRGG